MAQVEVLQRIGRVFLQVGNVQEARRFWNHAEILVLKAKSCALSAQQFSSQGHEEQAMPAFPPPRPPSRPPYFLGWAESQVGMGKGLLAVAEGRWEDAQRNFQKVAAAERTRLLEDPFVFDPALSPSPGSSGPTAPPFLSPSPWPSLLLPSPEDNLLLPAIINLAVLSLHRGNVHAAIHILENFIREDPPRNMTENLVLNLSYFYDLVGDKYVPVL
ncbi:hypothetical protein Naga_100378g3 [Nannochloropsis gaditana]|uniref:Uncharacterized protein n=1 Tax=Nannochloropsis gaditana TaxID=72520 RepID=W7TGB3_9STRA|nr:hypothetical protein Naga_100378g3 [Nannochloropsis gaditana]